VDDLGGGEGGDDGSVDNDDASSIGGTCDCFPGGNGEEMTLIETAEPLRRLNLQERGSGRSTPELCRLRQISQVDNSLANRYPNSQTQ
jgi:hypothetical protein